MFHDDVENVAKDRGAMIISQALLSAMVLQGAQSAFKSLNMKSIPSYNTGIDLRLLSVSTPPNQLTAKLSTVTGQPSLEITPSFDVAIAVHLAGSAADEFSIVTLLVSQISIPLSTTDHDLKFAPPICSVSGQVANSATRAAALAKPNAPTDKDVERVEGALAFLIAPRVFASIIGEVPPISLPKLFPNFAWSALINMEVLDEYLLLIPEDGHLKEQTGCPENHGANDWDIEVKDGVETPNGADSEIDVPITVTPPPRRKGQGREGPSIVALYLPQPILDQKFKNIYPAVCFEDQGSGFLGFYTQACVGFEGIKVEVDVKRLGVEVTVEAKMWGKATVNVDIPCVGRVDVAYTTKLQIKTSTIQVFIGLKIENGKLILVSNIDQLSIGDIEIYVVALAAYLALAGGWGAVIGFVLDRVVDQVLRHNVNIALRHGIEDAVNSKSFSVLDFGKYLPFLQVQPNTPMFSGRKKSVIWGVEFNPGLGQRKKKGYKAGIKRA